MRSDPRSAERSEPARREVLVMPGGVVSVTVFRFEGSASAAPSRPEQDGPLCRLLNWLGRRG